MLHVIERQQAQIEHHHAIIQVQIVAPARRNPLDQPHHSAAATAATRPARAPAYIAP